MTRQIDTDSLQAIAQREGLRLTAYQDTGGTWTIGYGRAHGVSSGDVITEQQALDYLREDVKTAEDCVCACIKVTLSDNQYGALVSFCYNIGCAAFSSSTLVKNLNQGDYAGVPQQMLRWVKVHGVTDPGLVNRRNSEGGQWVKGAYVRGADIAPDTPPPYWKQVLKTAHLKIKAAGTTIASLGIGGSQLKDAGSQLKGYASDWHVLAWVGIAMCVIGVGIELFHRKEE